MTFVAHYDLKLHQMNAKTISFNENLEKYIYMEQPMGFVGKGNECMVCKLKKSIYGLKKTF